ncbi:MAG: calcium/sodium antiporter [Candidatus Doudnabacteria bacterium]|nr:calcium/sodium antiporter [Candidatus Doudnabacteria bacterium]
MLTYILFVIGFLVLIKGADWLVEGAASVAKRLAVSDIAIGLTVVAFGTSMPEMMVNLFASAQGNTEIAIGNILGSNIANILLILGISSMIYPLSVHKNTVWKEIPLSLLAVVIVGLLANDVLVDGAAASVLTRSEGLTLIGFFVIFMYYTFGIAKASEENISEREVREHGLVRSLVFVMAGLLALVLGGAWIVNGAVALASAAGLSQSLIGLTIVAVGTSLPELATSVVAAYRKNTDIAIGNVVGSNIFNIFWILGLSAVIRPLSFNATANADVAMVIVASLLLFLFLFVGKKHILERWQGLGFVCFYIGYLIFLVMRG